MTIIIVFIFVIVLLLFLAWNYEVNKNEKNKKFENLVHKQKDLIEKNRRANTAIHFRVKQQG